MKINDITSKSTLPKIKERGGESRVTSEAGFAASSKVTFSDAARQLEAAQGKLMGADGVREDRVQAARQLLNSGRLESDEVLDGALDRLIAHLI